MNASPGRDSGRSYNSSVDLSSKKVFFSSICLQSEDGAGQAIANYSTQTSPTRNTLDADRIFGIESIKNLIADRRNRFINRYGETDNYLCQMLR